MRNRTFDVSSTGAPTGTSPLYPRRKYAKGCDERQDCDQDRQPDPPHGAPRLGMAGGSLAEDGGSQELAALVEHGLLDDLVGAVQRRDPDVEHLSVRQSLPPGSPLVAVLPHGAATPDPDFTQELPRKLLPTRAKKAQRRLRKQPQSTRGVVCGALAPLSI